MAKTNYPEELTSLVEEYLIDGVISQKERQVLLNKAQSLGVNVDEFDLYIDAQQQKVDQQVDAAASKKRGKTCPFCGGALPQLVDKCPHCGETVTAEASEELQEIFDYLEEALVDFKSGKDIERSKANVDRYVRKAKMYYENNPKVKRLLEEVQSESSQAEARAKKNARNETIKNVLAYNWKVTALAVVALIALVWWGIDKIFIGPELSTEEKASVLLKDGKIDEAMQLMGKRNPAFAHDADKAILKDLEIAYLDKKEYEKAIDVWDRSGGCARDNYRILCEIIDRMQDDGESAKLKKFIDKHLSLFYESDQQKYKEMLYEYAEI